MSEKSLQVFVSYLDEPPEFDANETQLEKNFKRGYFESSKLDIIDTLGKDDFKNVWFTLKNDIQNESIKLQAIFSEQTLDKIFELYDFSFSANIGLENQYEINNFYLFLEFLEYDNTNFISQVWRFLGPKNLLQIDIKKFCDSNQEKIIKEIDEQLEVHPQPKLIALFLRTYYKDKMIEWFIKNSKRTKVEITVSILEREE